MFLEYNPFGTTCSIKIHDLHNLHIKVVKVMYPDIMYPLNTMPKKNSYNF